MSACTASLRFAVSLLLYVYAFIDGVGRRLMSPLVLRNRVCPFQQMSVCAITDTTIMTCVAHMGCIACGQPRETCLCRGEPVGDCGGCQVMSNPLILHGTQITLPKSRPLLPRPMPLIPEGLPESSPVPAGTHCPAESGAVVGQGVQASTQPGAGVPQPPLQASPPPFRSASNKSVFMPSASQPVKPPCRAPHVTRDSEDAKDKVLNADERLQRLKLRMQSTIQAYSGSPSSAAAHAGRYNRSQSMTAALPHTAFHRTNSSPTRPSRVSLCGISRRATEETGSCNSSSSCSSVATPAGLEDSMNGGANPGSSRGDDRSLMQARTMGSKRGIPQVPCCCYNCTSWLALGEVGQVVLALASSGILTQAMCKSMQAPAAANTY